MSVFIIHGLASIHAQQENICELPAGSLMAQFLWPGPNLESELFFCESLKNTGPGTMPTMVFSIVNRDLDGDV